MTSYWFGVNWLDMLVLMVHASLSIPQRNNRVSRHRDWTMSRTFEPWRKGCKRKGWHQNQIEEVKQWRTILAQSLTLAR
jgi:hypothetical protein